VWDIERGAVLFEDPGPLAGSTTAFRRDSRRMAIAHEDGDVITYDVGTRQPIARWRLPGSQFMAFSADGARLAVVENATRTPTLRIVAAETGRPVQSPIVLPGMASVAWSRDGTMLATPGDDRTIHVWDADSGNRRATLEGHTNGGITAGFHPLANLLASDGWERRLRLWDPILGRTLPSEGGESVIDGHFSRDGRVVLSTSDRLTTYEVEPAFEFRTLVSPSTGRVEHGRLSISPDGRVLAAGTPKGVVLWDLERGNELGLLTIGHTPYVVFEPSGDLLTNGFTAVRRWPIRLDALQGEFRVGPPRAVPFVSGKYEVASDRLGHVVASAGGHWASVSTPDRAFQLRSLGEVRSVAVSPDGEWIATGSHGRNGAQVWAVRDATRVADLDIDGLVAVQFSPDGKWLLTTSPPCRLWKVGTWREPRVIGGEGLCFSDALGLVVVKDEDQVLRLVETETGRTVARLSSPDLGDIWGAALSPDGSRLAVSNHSAPAVQVWDLGLIRSRLKAMGLDWDTRASSPHGRDEVPASPLPRLEVDYGPLAEELEYFNEPAEVLVERYADRVRRDPDDARAHHTLAHALGTVGRFAEAIEQIAHAIRLRPREAHYRTVRGLAYREQRQYESAIADLDAVLQLEPDNRRAALFVADVCNARAWELATGHGHEPRGDGDQSLALARRAAQLNPWDSIYLTTLGVALYRAGQDREAIDVLERSLQAGHGRPEPFNLFVLAMAHHRLRHAGEAAACFDRAVRWTREHPQLDEQTLRDLAGFRTEAERVLAGSAGPLPDQVFAGPRS
jgi:WD40 repeat protein/tetratricopeptide (TPR) repeat protein